MLIFLAGLMLLYNIAIQTVLFYSGNLSPYLFWPCLVVPIIVYMVLIWPKFIFWLSENDKWKIMNRIDYLIASGKSLDAVLLEYDTSYYFTNRFVFSYFGKIYRSKVESYYLGIKDDLQ